MLALLEGQLSVVDGVASAASSSADDLRFSSCSCFDGHGFPNPLRFENEFDRFADCAVARECFRRVVRGCFHLGDGVADGDGKANAAH